MRENGGVALYRDDGIVLRTQDLGEADRIITVLTRRTGRIRAVGKGVRRTKSRFGARLEPFTHVDLLLYEGRSLDIVTQADSLRAYGEPLASDYPRYTAGVAMRRRARTSPASSMMTPSIFVPPISIPIRMKPLYRTRFAREDPE